MTTQINLHHLWHEISLLPIESLPYLQAVVEKLRTQTLPTEAEILDWDEILQDIHTHRQNNNQRLMQNLDNLTF